MPQAKAMYRVKCKCTYGAAGDIVSLDVAKLTPRQEVMLEKYEAPEVKKVDKKDDKKS